MSGIGNYLEDSGARVPAGSGWRKLRCPFHGADTTPSATVNHDIGRFYCHSCGINEDLIGLIRLREGVSYTEAKQKATEEFGEGNQEIFGESGICDWVPRRSGNRKGHSGSGASWRSSFA